jgi:hypothetical protein
MKDYMIFQMVPVEDIQMPVYLDKDVMQFLNKLCDFNAEKIKFIN